MSDQSKKTPANRPAHPRVFRPFAGRPEGEGKGSPAPASESPGRGAPRAFRPFVAKSDARSTLASPADVAAGNLEPSPPPPGAPPPETWALSEDIAGPERPSQSITAEVPIYDDHRATPAILEAIAEPVRKTTVTRELPAISEDEELVGSQEHEASFMVSERESVELLDASTFVSPRGGAVAESMIDEVDAAFITAGLPAAAPVASPEAMIAAAALEDIAELLRAGAIELRPAPAVSVTSKESALASVLAALLAKR